jgi:hypothetical protein
MFAHDLFTPLGFLFQALIDGAGLFISSADESPLFPISWSQNVGMLCRVRIIFLEISHVHTCQSFARERHQSPHLIWWVNNHRPLGIVE